MNQTLLDAENLTIGYTQHRRAPAVVAEDLSASLGSGEFICLIGPNGAGKTTLLRTLAGLLPALGGQVTLTGTDIHALDPSERARLLSVVLTERIDVGNLSVYSLVALGRHPYTDWIGRLKEEDEEAVRWAIDAAGATDLAHRSFNELSDGERQKVLIARGLAQEPRLMILDEPTAFLDLPRRVETMHLLRRLARTTDRSFLLSTHDLELALRSADRIWLLPPGGPLQVGAPEDLVLSGAFEDTFRGEGVNFDASSGSFTIDHEHRGTVALEGEGVEAFWAKRALEREGFDVVADDESCALRLEIRSEADDRVWELTVGGRSDRLKSLAEVVAALEERRRDEDATRA